MSDPDFYTRLITLLMGLEVLPEAHFPLGCLRRAAISQLLEQAHSRLNEAEEQEEARRHAEWTRS